MSSLALETFKRSVTPAVLEAARRLNDAEVQHYPAIAVLLSRRRALGEQQAAAQKRADEAKAVIDAIAEKRTNAEHAVRDAERARDQAAGKALLGDPEAEKDYHSACFAVAKAERVVAMHDHGLHVLVSNHEGLTREARAYAGRSNDLDEELGEELYKARVAEIQRRNAARL